MIRTGWAIPFGLVAGVVLAQSLFVFGWVIWPFICGLSLCFAIARNTWLAAVIIGLSWATLGLHSHLADRLDPTLAGSSLLVDGQITGLPEIHDEYTRFLFRPVAMPASVRLPRKLLTYWYRDAPLMLPGDTWRLKLKLNPPWGRLNLQGPDREKWLFSEGIGALATVESGQLRRVATGRLVNWDGVRQRIRERLAATIADENSRAIVSALAIADRSNLSRRQRFILSSTGTTHLLAISGLHIGLAATIGCWFARLLIMFMPLRWTRGMAYPASLLAGLMLALAYAALAGFATSAIRALLMLSVGVLALLTRREIHPGQAFLAALVLVLLFDPLSFLSAGFWLSFCAVGVLLLLFSKGHCSQHSRWRQVPRAQTAIMLVLLPLSAWWFQSASVIGLIANLLAIPFVSMLTVPLVLVGLLALPLSAAGSSLILSAAAASVGWLLEFLTILAGLPFSFLAIRQPPIYVLVPGTLGALLLLLPRGLRYRWLGLIFLLPLFTPDRPPGAGEVQMDVLDVGQGTAVLVSSRSHLMLYDSGPGNGNDFDLVDSVIRPAILRSGHPAPDRIVISHADLDHAGGLQSLIDQYPGASVFTGYPAPGEGIKACDDNLGWFRDGLSFEVLHPSPWLPYLGNDSSCVLNIASDTYAILLPGDIAGAAEHRLVKRGMDQADILLVPHHGSRSSSSPEFLRAIRPRVAIATAGLGNRFGFPRDEVRQRYRDAGILLWSTNDCGAIRVLVSANGTIQASSARRSRPAPWRWPAARPCP